MKVLLRDPRTGCYLGRDDRWVAHCEEALEFDSLHEAGRRAYERHHEAKVVLRYSDPVCELAVNPAFCV